MNKVDYLLLTLPLVFHALHAIFATIGPDYLRLNIYNVVSLITLLMALISTFANLLNPAITLNLITYPLAGVSLFISACQFNNGPITDQLTLSVLIHIGISLLAYSVLMCATLFAVLIFFLDKALRRHRNYTWLNFLPPLQLLEKTMFLSIGTGLCLLSIAILTGFFIFDNLLEQHLAHKTLLSILAWIVFGVILLAKIKYGYRGLPAIKWILFASILLLLSYLGSKIALELIFDKI